MPVPHQPHATQLYHDWLMEIMNNEERRRLATSLGKNEHYYFEQHTIDPNDAVMRDARYAASQSRMHTPPVNYTGTVRSSFPSSSSSSSMPTIIQEVIDAIMGLSSEQVAIIVFAILSAVRTSPMGSGAVAGGSSSGLVDYTNLGYGVGGSAGLMIAAQAQKRETMILTMIGIAILVVIFAGKNKRVKQERDLLHSLLMQQQPQEQQFKNS